MSSMVWVKQSVSDKAATEILRLPRWQSSWGLPGKEPISRLACLSVDRPQVLKGILPWVISSLPQSNQKTAVASQGAQIEKQKGQMTLPSCNIVSEVTTYHFYSSPSEVSQHSQPTRKQCGAGAGATRVWPSEPNPEAPIHTEERNPCVCIYKWCCHYQQLIIKEHLRQGLALGPTQRNNIEEKHSFGYSSSNHRLTPVMLWRFKYLHYPIEPYSIQYRKDLDTKISN